SPIMSASVDVLAHRPSLLDRRASNNFPDRPDRLSVSALFASPNHGQSATPNYARATAPRKPSAPLLPFVPLTPIMASPLITPDVAHAPTPAALLDGAGRQHTSGHDPPVQEQDYISHHHASPPNPTWTTSPPTPPSKLTASPRAAASSSAALPVPMRASRGRSNSSSVSSGRSRSASSHRSGPRPASIASYAPTPLSRSYSPSPSLAEPKTTTTASVQGATHPHARRLSLPADLSKPLPPRPISALGAPKELPPVPSSLAPANASSSATETRGAVIDAVLEAEPETLLPSLSRRSANSLKGSAVGSDETSTLRGRAQRKLFSLTDDEAEGDVSDTEEQRATEAVRIVGGQKRGAPERTESVQEMVGEEVARGSDPAREQERAERLRRYHALMELLTTEVGYLLDLRILVTVYLDQLMLLSTSSSSSATSAAVVGPSGLPTPPLAQPLCLGVPLPSSGRSMSSLSALSIPSLFPSSRSSFFHHSPAPSPSPSTADFLAHASPVERDADEGSSGERTRQSSGVSTCTEGTSRERDRERERDKENLERVPPPPPPQAHRSTKASRHNSAPVLAEKEVRAVCRNARELLSFHERFVGELRAAVGLVGFGMVLGGGDGEDEAWMRDMHGDGEGVVADLVEHAVEVVANKFVNEAAAFGIYETFCPGHAAATDLVRRAQERWPAIWDAYEQRCMLLVARNPDSYMQQSSHQHDRGRSDGIVTASPSSYLQTPSEEAGQRRAPSTYEGSMRKKRRHSTPALTAMATSDGAGLPGSLPFPPASGALSATLPAPNTSPSSERRMRGTGTGMGTSAGTGPPKLKFMDYLIKPVQRICKYPLLLDQLRPKRRDARVLCVGGAQAVSDEAARLAGAAMRDVVSRVNRASEKEAHNLRSALIASRIVYSHASASAPGSGFAGAPSAYSPTATATPPSASGTASRSGSVSRSSSSHGHGSSTSSCVSSPTTTPATSSAYTTPSPGPAASLPPLATASPRVAGLTAEFVSSLGPCMLAGALDVVHHPAHRAKYLGAFLYAGGYCVLVKVAKGGRAYEPRQWFALGAGGVEVVDGEEDDPAFPYSFHIIAYGHHLQLAASCAQEKAIWLAAINDALATRPSWTNEPLSSFQADDKSPVSATLEEGPQESPSGLPTIQSLSELEKQQGDGAAGETFAGLSASASGSTPPTKGQGQLKYSRTLSRLDSLTLRQEGASTFSAALSRRSSTASVKAFFGSFDGGARGGGISRPSGQVRAQVEQGLHDLFSETCLAARSQAQMRGEELFQLRVPAGVAGAGGMGMGMAKRQGSGIGIGMGIGVPRSNSGISIANAMGLTAAKRRYDSVLVSRRKASMDGVPDFTIPGSANSSVPASTLSGHGLSGRAKSLAVRRHKKQPASIAPAITAIALQKAERGTRGDDRRPEALSLDSPPAASDSRCSSVSSHPGADSLLPSPTESSPLPIPVPGLSPSGTLRQSDISQVPGADANAKPKRSRSMVGNVRHFFSHGQRDDPPPPLPPLGVEPVRGSPSPVKLLVESPTSEYPTGIVQWLRRTSLRRRNSGSSGSRSTTDDHHGPPSPHYNDSRRPFPTRNSSDGASSARTHSPARAQIPPPPSSARQLSFSSGSGSGAAPKRRRSLFVPSSRSRDSGLAPRDASDEAPRAEADAPSAHAQMPSRRSIKNILLFQRSNSLTPVRK
ncbi:hypothetical protein GY45DRAFT_1252653, partial [Cubamyces sp. BRFM 1775]